ncbi:uncharacterized protein LOC120204477 [Hibiscus syriacus]|uniref:uncharacterized protein LOC120204477 n=1 Tax=Hibiscus syriacus TaxID=106335 RepID=UPI0019219EC2|nr:uncharacterized protein LOC120204477 [Hibiscus syriacus]
MEKLSRQMVDTSMGTEQHQQPQPPVSVKKQVKTKPCLADVEVEVNYPFFISKILASTTCRSHFFETLDSSISYGRHESTFDHPFRGQVSSIRLSSLTTRTNALPYHLSVHSIVYFSKATSFGALSIVLSSLPYSDHLSDESSIFLWRRCETKARVRINVKLTLNQGSRAFVASRYAMRKDDEEPNRMDFFKATHYSNDRGWTTSEAQAKYKMELQSTPVEEEAKPKNIDDIVDDVLGTRPGYILGLGYGQSLRKQIQV